MGNAVQLFISSSNSASKTGVSVSDGAGTDWNKTRKDRWHDGFDVNTNGKAYINHPFFLQA